MELVEDSVSGFVVDDVQSAVCAVGRLSDIDRAKCRAAFEQRFTVARMTDDYLAIYAGLLPESGRVKHSMPDTNAAQDDH